MLSRAAQHDQLLFEQEILSDDGSHAAGSTELRGRDGKAKQGEQARPEWTVRGARPQRFSLGHNGSSMVAASSGLKSSLNVPCG
jgi:hypothetical protein